MSRWKSQPGVRVRAPWTVDACGVAGGLRIFTLLELAANVYDIERNWMKMKTRYKEVDLLHDGLASRRELAQE